MRRTLVRRVPVHKPCTDMSPRCGGSLAGKPHHRNSVPISSQKYRDCVCLGTNQRGLPSGELGDSGENAGISCMLSHRLRVVTHDGVQPHPGSGRCHLAYRPSERCLLCCRAITSSRAHVKMAMSDHLERLRANLPDEQLCPNAAERACAPVQQERQQLRDTVWIFLALSN
jgi:hypothetical protein